MEKISLHALSPLDIEARLTMANKRGQNVERVIGRSIVKIRNSPQMEKMIGVPASFVF
jgi:hypothetical protein